MCACADAIASERLASERLASELLLDDKAIYHTDDRFEIVNASDKMQGVARSVGALVSRTSLVNVSASRWELTLNQTGRQKGWCPSERFIDQPTAASCTGFLVAPDQLATSAHCVQPENDPYAPGLSCANLSIVFGYAMSDEGRVLNQFERDSIYHCERVLAGENDPVGSDWRIIELDREAQNINTLTVYKGAAVSTHWPLSIIGYPNGLPVKYGRNARVVDASQTGYFVTDIDSYVGNSGSPVFVETDSEVIVVGVLSRGAEDYIEVNQGLDSCLQSRQCTTDTCGGEHVTPARVLEEFAVNTLDKLVVQ